MLFLGVVALDLLYGAEPHPGGNPTVLSELAAAAFSGPGRPLYYLVQASTLLVLVMAANTSFNGFPRLAAILAQDSWLPHRLTQVGNRLVHSTSIVFLALFAAVLVLAFGASTDAVINLFALGVFTAFTLAQAGMARHWWRERGRGWRRRLAINGLGAAVSALVDVVIVITKTPPGAWVVVVLVPFLVGLFWGVGRFYAGVRSQLAGAEPRGMVLGPALVPVLDCDRATLAATRYARTLGGEVRAVHLARSATHAARMRRQWAVRYPMTGLHLDTVVARSRTRAFLRQLDRTLAEAKGHTVTVVLPSWRRGSLMDRPIGLALELGVHRRTGVVAATVPATTRPEGWERVALVPIGDLMAPAWHALAFASAIADRAVAVHVATASEAHPQPDPDRLAGDFAAWASAGSTGVRMKLVRIDSPYRSVVAPLVAYVNLWRRSHPEPVCTVVVPEVADERWWSFLLYDHRALWLRGLLSRTGVAMADVTYHVR